MFGIITETGNTYFSHTAEQVYTEAKNNSNIDIITYRQLQANERVGLNQNASKITLVSTSLKTTLDVLCSAYMYGTVWPEYVWILHSYLLDDIKRINAGCSINRALENVIFIRQQVPNRSMFNSTYNGLENHTNPYSAVLHDLVWMTAHDLLNLSAPEEQSTIVSYNEIEVTQVRNATEITLVHINSSDITLFDDEIKEVVISDEFEMRFEGASTGYTVIFSIEIVIGFIFVTIMLIGYVYFHNEPEVKSTSFMLSLLIFLGCYLNLMFLLFLP